ncbi:uncharacterized protein EDB91DRAFT_1083072 [Suillus paluster]|uniref:uncharacterized protein n=1 Tax=Suillus paluster TaxID=48578 RepID=UPI001B87DC8D|nr:uncharacterized protein EDB91DRAFT_1083072 [Suillus paluster]KAG1737561.1 hypothetical protein EDB91DRAFT_1083072 [Suillus paluster]
MKRKKKLQDVVMLRGPELVTVELHDDVQMRNGMQLRTTGSVAVEAKRLRALYAPPVSINIYSPPTLQEEQLQRDLEEKRTDTVRELQHCEEAALLGAECTADVRFRTSLSQDIRLANFNDLEVRAAADETGWEIGKRHHNSDDLLQELWFMEPLEFVVRVDHQYGWYGVVRGLKKPTNILSRASPAVRFANISATHDTSTSVVIVEQQVSREHFNDQQNAERRGNWEGRNWIEFLFLVSHQRTAASSHWESEEVCDALPRYPIYAFNAYSCTLSVLFGMQKPYILFAPVLRPLAPRTVLTQFALSQHHLPPLAASEPSCNFTQTKIHYMPSIVGERCDRQCRALCQWIIDCPSLVSVMRKKDPPPPPIPDVHCTVYYKICVCANWGVVSTDKHKPIYADYGNSGEPTKNALVCKATSKLYQSLCSKSVLLLAFSFSQSHFIFNLTNTSQWRNVMTLSWTTHVTLNLSHGYNTKDHQFIGGTAVTLSQPFAV